MPRRVRSTDRTVSARITPHTEKTQINAIHAQAREASTCRVAVAYCGEAAHMFFPEAAAERPENLRIIVDASDAAVRRGLTNPKGVAHLLGLTPQVRSVEGLHAKVFLFDERVALVGSTNLSESSLKQDQMTLEVSNAQLVQRLTVWFEDLFEERGKQLDSVDVKRLMGLWPRRPPLPITHEKKDKFPTWQGAAPQPPPAPSDFKVGTSKGKIQSLLSEFKSNKCPYPGSSGSCLEESGSAEERHVQAGKRLRALMNRTSRWTKDDLIEIFEMAQTYGQAAMMWKPKFIRQSPKRVAKSLTFLLNGDGDPYARFEKLLVSGSGYKLTGLGEAGVIFLMHLWSPKEFAVVNQPVDDALKILKFSFGRETSQRRAEAYRDRTAAVMAVARLTKLKTLARVDHFLDAIGKGHIG